MSDNPPAICMVTHQTHEMPEALREKALTPAQQKGRELAANMRAAREGKVRVGSTWRHYKGGIYRIEGYVFDTEQQVIKARYKRIGGPDFDPMYERENEFARDIAEWDDVVTDMQTDKGRLIVHRFESVEEIRRYETAAEIKERG